MSSARGPPISRAVTKVRRRAAPRGDVGFDQLHMRTETAVATLLVATSAVAVLGSASQQATTTEPPRATVALVEAWPDGRVNYELTSTRRAVMWTPQFPRLRGYTPPEGTPPVYAVQFARALVGGEIKVDVSVLLGSATPPGVAVTTVTISRGSHVVVNALTKFGVQPVTLSMVDVTPFLPTVISVSPQVEIARVELLTAPYPRLERAVVPVNDPPKESVG